MIAETDSGQSKQRLEWLSVAGAVKQPTIEQPKGDGDAGTKTGKMKDWIMTEQTWTNERG